MRRALVFALLLLPMVAWAQEPDHRHHPKPHNGMPASAMPIPAEPGQSAFAAIQEIIQILETDPRTDWSKVNIEALRQHLIDMNNVTLAAHVRSEPIDGGIRFIVTGDAVRDSIRRMTSAHAATMDGVGGWHFTAKDTDDGSIIEVQVPSQDMDKLRGLGFIGVMTRGMHHQEHHLMIARGGHPHQ